MTTAAVKTTYTVSDITYPLLETWKYLTTKIDKAGSLFLVLSGTSAAMDAANGSKFDLKKSALNGAMMTVMGVLIYSGITAPEVPPDPFASK